MNRYLSVLLIALCATAVSAADLVPLIRPAEITLTLYPGQTRAQVRETRPVSLPAGASELSFSWAAANLDAASATLTIAGAVVGDAVRAAGQDKTLLWRVNSPQAVQGEAVVTYFLEGCKWHPTYALWLQADGETASLVANLHLTNETGVDLQGARVQVAAAGPGLLDTLGGTQTPAADAVGTTVHALPAPLDLPAGETAVRPLLKIDKVPASRRYVYQAERFNGAVEAMLVLNLPAGIDGLPEGAMRILSAGEDGIPVFNTQLSYQPGQELKVDLGPEPDVVVERKLLNTTRNNLETDRFGRLTGSDTTEDYLTVFRSRLPGKVNVEYTETVLSTWELKTAVTPTKTETSSAQFDLPLLPGQQAELKFTLVKHSGSRAKK